MGVLIIGKLNVSTDMSASEEMLLNPVELHANSLSLASGFACVTSATPTTYVATFEQGACKLSSSLIGGAEQHMWLGD